MNLNSIEDKIWERDVTGENESINDLEMNLHHLCLSFGNLELDRKM